MTVHASIKVRESNGAFFASLQRFRAKSTMSADEAVHHVAQKYLENNKSMKVSRDPWLVVQLQPNLQAWGVVFSTKEWSS